MVVARHSNMTALPLFLLIPFGFALTSFLNQTYVTFFMKLIPNSKHRESTEEYLKSYITIFGYNASMLPSRLPLTALSCGISAKFGLSRDEFRDLAVL